MTGKVMVERHFGSEAISYARKELSNGGTYSRHLAELPLEDGDITSYLPREVAIARTIDLEHSVFLRTTVEMKQSRLTTAGFVRNYLGEGPKRIALFETLSRVGDPLLLSESLPYVTHLGEVYVLATHTESSTEAILKRIKRARHYPFVAGLIDPVGIRIQPGPPAEVPGDDLGTLARNTDHIVIGAFDMEGFLIWSRPGSSRRLRARD